MRRLLFVLFCMLCGCSCPSESTPPDAGQCTDDLCIDHAWCEDKYGAGWTCYDEQHCCPPGATPAVAVGQPLSTECNLTPSFTPLGYYVGHDPAIYPWLQSEPGFSAWATSDCSGEVYAPPSIAETPTSRARSCVQFHPVYHPSVPVGPPATEGEVWCADQGGAGVEQIYWRDWNQGGACMPWTLTSGTWVPWRFCAIMPL